MGRLSGCVCHSTQVRIPCLESKENRPKSILENQFCILSIRVICQVDIPAPSIIVTIITIQNSAIKTINIHTQVHCALANMASFVNFYFTIQLQIEEVPIEFMHPLIDLMRRFA